MKKKTNNEKLKTIIFIIAACLIVMVVLFYPYFRPRKVIWCNFEQNISDSPIPRNECAHLKIISRDIEQIDLDKFYALNITTAGCYDSYDELPACFGDEYHFTQLDLYMLSDDDVDGTLCATYHVSFYESNETLAEGYRDLYRAQNFKEQIDYASELREKLIGCEVR